MKTITNILGLLIINIAYGQFNLTISEQVINDKIEINLHINETTTSLYNGLFIINGNELLTLESSSGTFYSPGVYYSMIPGNNLFYTPCSSIENIESFLTFKVINNEGFIQYIDYNFSNCSTLNVKTDQLESKKIIIKNTEIIFTDKYNNMKYEIYNILGNKVKKGKVLNNVIDIKYFKEGLYFLKFENNLFLKFIKL